jgi:NADPH:quinone reductase-like Zn-dependent oxidoreductase
MLAFRVAQHGGPEALERVELDVPRPSAGQALVRVRACGLNHLDLWVRRGVPGHQFPLPLVPGSEIAGDLVAWGNDAEGPDSSHGRPRGLSLGDPVLVAPGVSCGLCDACLDGDDPLCADYGILGETTDGGYAEYAVVPARNLLPLPRGLSYAEAASVPLAFLTAWHMLEARARLRPFEDVLVQAAGSGVSSAAIQIARLFGARTIVATAGGDDKLARARALGASHVVNYREQDFVKFTKAVTGGAGVDVAIEHVGGEVFEKTLRCLKRGGRVVLCGATTGGEATINLRAVFFKSLAILGSTMGGLGELKRLLRHFETGELVPVVAARLPLERAREAQELLESREVFGKVVLEVEASARPEDAG